MQRTIEVLRDGGALAEAAADRFVADVEAALASRGHADVALAGGTTPRSMNALLAASPRRERIAWSRLRFFFGDERSVPPDHPDSNYRMNRETLFDPLGLPESRIFRMRGEDEPRGAADAYSRVLAEQLGPQPRFDVLFLGMGPDGHTASLFPGTLASIDDRQLAAANWVEKFSTWRITLTPHVINAARSITITAGGAEKADALRAVLEGPHEPDTYPVQLVAPADGVLHWLIDAAAAAKLTARGSAARSSSA